MSLFLFSALFYGWPIRLTKADLHGQIGRSKLKLFVQSLVKVRQKTLKNSGKFLTFPDPEYEVLVRPDPE